MQTTAQQKLAEKKVHEWNAKHPPGTPVLYSPYLQCPERDKVKTRTRSEAYVSCSGMAVVFTRHPVGHIGLDWLELRAAEPDDMIDDKKADALTQMSN